MLLCLVSRALICVQAEMEGGLQQRRLAAVRGQLQQQHAAALAADAAAHALQRALDKANSEAEGQGAQGVL